MKISFNKNIIYPQIFALNKTKKNYPRYSNLSPLPCDTVSFKNGGYKFESKEMGNSPAETVCRQVRINAEPAEVYLKRVLDNWIGPLSKKTVIDSGKKKIPAFTYITGRKSAESIREKVVSKYSKIVRDENEEFSNHLATELLKNFKFTQQQNVKSLSNEICGILDKLQGDRQKFSPYNHPDYPLDIVIDKFIKSKKINMDGVSDEQLLLKKEMIIESITSKSRPEEEENYDGNTFIKPANIRGIKHYANDIVRARIVMNHSGREYTQMVINALSLAAKRGDLKITSVENYVPSPLKLPKGKRPSDYAYIKESALIDFAESVGARYSKNISKKGYIGIHINLDLSNGVLSKQGKQFTGYSGEIQLVGRDVLKLKDVEDLCYKIKDNKNSLDDMYYDFKEEFGNNYLKCDKQEFDDYTYALYLSQRELPPNTPEKARFKTPRELGFKNVPKELDFNNLAQLKEDCEKAARAKKNI